jgi:hypothetical protein
MREYVGAFEVYSNTLGVIYHDAERGHHELVKHPVANGLWYVYMNANSKTIFSVIFIHEKSNRKESNFSKLLHQKNTEVSNGRYLEIGDWDYLDAIIPSQYLHHLSCLTTRPIDFSPFYTMNKNSFALSLMNQSSFSTRIGDESNNGRRENTMGIIHLK